MDKLRKLKEYFPIYRQGWVVYIAAMLTATVVLRLLQHISESDRHVPLIFVLVALVVSLCTDGYFYGILTAVTGVFTANYTFTYPYSKMDFTLSGYPLTFVTMLAVSVDKYDLLVSVRDKWPSCLVAFIFAAAVIAALYWFFGTELGSAIRATGANGNMSRAQGINTDFMKIVGLVLSNGLVGLSGGLFMQYQGNVTATMGQGAIVTGLAAVIIGEVLFSKIFRNFALRMAGVIIGAILYYVASAVVIQLGLNTDDLKLFSAAFVAVALYVPYWKDRHAKTSFEKGGKNHA